MSDVFYGYLGRSVTLQCPVSSSIKEMRWYFKNGIFKILHTINASGTFPSSARYEASITSATLTIHNLDLPDAALYKCTVSDGRTLKEDYVLLKIADSHSKFIHTKLGVMNKAAREKAFTNRLDSNVTHWNGSQKVVLM